MAKARDIDAKALTMSFTTLSRRITDAAKGSETAVDSFKDIGVTQKELKQTGGDFNQQLLVIANAFGEAEGGAVRQQAAQKLLGRGYQTLLPMFADGAEGLKEQQKWADKYGATLGGKTVKEQMALVNAQRESKVAMLGLQVSFTEALTPALMEANQQFQKISQIIGSDKLTKGEKLEKVGKIIAGWADDALDAFVKVLPTMVEKAGEMAPKIAGAFIKGFLNAPVWGQIVLGGFLLAKMGGLTALATLGTRAGATFGGALKMGLRATGIGALIIGAFEAWDRISGAHAARVADEWGTTFGGKLDKAIKDKSIPALQSLANEANLTNERLEDLGWGGAADAVGDKAEKMSARVQAALDKMNTQGIQDSKIAVSEMENTWTKKMRQMAGISEKELDHIGDLLREKPKKGVEALDQAMGKMVDSIRQAMKDGVLSTRKGSKQIHSVLIDQLGIYGISHGGAQKIIQATEHGGKSLQRGGPIDQGRPSGDSVPALLERGEYVLNRNATKAVGKDRLDALNFGAAKRFAVGGMAGLQPGISRLAEWANQRYGLTVSSGFRSGTGSLHNVGAAVDLVPPGMAATKGIFGAFKNQLAELFYDPWGGWDSGQQIGAIGDHLDHIHAAILGAGAAAAGGMGRAKIKLPRFKATAAMFTPGAAGLNNSAQALEKIMGKRAAAATASAGHTGGSAGALSVGQFLALARRAIKITGAGNFSAQGLLTLAQQESSLIPSSINNWDSNAAAGNPSGGLMHLTQSNMKAYAEPGLGSNMFDPLASIAASINYQIARYGGQVTHSPYMLGGLVGMAEGGDPFAPKGAFGRAHYKMAQLPGMKKRIQKLAKKIAKTDERIQIAQTLAGYPTSPGGTELAGTEKTKQLGLLERLLRATRRPAPDRQAGLPNLQALQEKPGLFPRRPARASRTSPEARGGCSTRGPRLPN